MTIPIVKVGDQCRGLCTSAGNPFFFSGTVIKGAQSVTADGMPVCNVGAQAITDCPDCQIVNVVSGSATVTAEGVGCCRLGDQVQGPAGASGNIISASPDVTVA